MSVRRRRRPIAEINVVPYIDVMLVLLVIFMVTAPLLFQGVQVALPEASAKPMDQSHKAPLIITVDRQGRYYLNTASRPKEALASQDLLKQVHQAMLESKERPVLVKGDREATYEQVISAMVLLQKAGVAQIGLLTQEK